MVSRDQAAKVVEMIDQGWNTVPHTVLTQVDGWSSTHAQGRQAHHGPCQ
jgi:hypothetical protein